MSEKPRQGQLSMLRLLYATVWLSIAFALWGAMLRLPLEPTTPPVPSARSLIACLAGGVFAFGTGVGVLLGRTLFAAAVFLVVAIGIAVALQVPAWLR
jgi:hypothetical protein